MKVTLAVVLAALLGALALSGPVDRDTPPPPPAQTADATVTPVPVTDDPPLLQWAGEREVQPSSPRTLRPKGRPILMPMAMGEGVLSPDGRRAVFQPHDPLAGDVMVLDVARGSAGKPIDVGDRAISHLTWLTNDRFVGFAPGKVVEVDAVRRRVVAVRRIRSRVVTTARSRDGVVALLAPPGPVGRARLLVRRPGRPDRSIRTLGVRAGRGVTPGLGVDPDGNVAYVVDAETDRLFEVDLETETQREGPMGRAAKVLDSRVRYAAWLGDGKLAIAGHRDRPDGSIEPHGLRIVDVNDSRRPVKLLAPRQDFLAAGQGRVVAWEVKGDGIAIFDREGRRERRLLRGTSVTHVDVHGAYAHVHTQDGKGRNADTRVIELSTGRQVGRGRANITARASAVAPPRETVLGVSYPGGGQGRIARYDPVTLRRVSRGAVVHGYLWGWDLAPGGGQVAVGVSSRGRIEIFDARNPRRARRIEVGRREAVRHVRWVTGDRMLVLAGQSGSEALEIDVPSGRVLSRRSLGHEYAVARTGDGLAVLVGPQEREGPARLVLLRAGEPLRDIALPGVRAAVHSRTAVRPADPPDLIPGLAVDGGVAYVAPANRESIVRVDLSSGATTSHAFRARAAKGGASQSRMLQLLAGGRLLITTQHVDHRDRVTRSSSEIVNTATWGRTMLSGSLADAVGSPAGIVLPRYRTRFFTVHAADGRQLARHDPRFGISGVRLHGDYAYVANAARRGRNHRTHVIDLRTGRRVRRLPFSTIPHLLTRP